MKNKKFTNLEVLNFSHVLNGHKYWRCICQCGQYCCVRDRHLITGSTKSCGCLKRKHISKIGKQRLADISNKNFGDLLVVCRVLNNKKDAHWLCKCKCGNKKIVCGYSLRIGKTKTCGNCFI